MKRLTKWIEGLEQARISCKICGKTAIYECWSQENCTQTAVDSLAAIEDILGDDYDLERLKVMMTQCMSMREEVSERFRITGSIPVERLRELVEADKASRCVLHPLKAEDEVYIAILGRVLPFEVTNAVWYGASPTYKAMHGMHLCFAFKQDDIGKAVFLTREAAEAALAKEADHE